MKNPNLVKLVLLTVDPFVPCRLLGIGCLDPKVHGYVAPEFIDVKKIFTGHFENGGEVGSSVATYYNGKLVVDLHGGYADLETMREYNMDTLQLVFSSTKVLTSIMIAYLVDRGLLSYDEKISKYWPEFAQGNKENVTLLDLVNHRAGVTYLDTQVTKSELEDLDKLAKILAAQPHAFDGVPLRAYHAATRGWYLNEIVRRVDPKHRTIGQIVSEEILKQYDLEFYLLLPQNLSSRVATFYHAPITEKIILIQWDYIIGRNFTPSVGGFSYFKFPGLEDVEFLGWGGFGGSLFIWNRELGISIWLCYERH
ncbi:beta-lactamase/transpeptidase-like protein [Gigaspora margarita]|uniref:Beta-lactamase/transpeptidase-like protein n=1 Tax=Gigaspora margarita TaxID=4874 RepID=A0A8H4ERE5_GIGMA|nr:beta-lactamase/transpeptidase-like protein [Gigaspora margarita]